MGASQPNPLFTVFNQGAGRVDVARAIAEEKSTTPASIASGSVFPHEDDEVLTRTVASDGNLR